MKTIVLLLAVMVMPARALQVLDAVDHAELEAEISGTSVNRIALEDDRIERVIRGPDGFQVEHDPNRGDIFLKPQYLTAGESLYSGPQDVASGESLDDWPRRGPAGEDPGQQTTIFIGTEKGFTYRLRLAVADRDSAQILIRNALRAQPAGTAAETGKPEGGHIAELTGLVRAVVNRTPLSGYAIAAGTGAETGMDGAVAVEVWRGPRFTAQVVELRKALGPEPETTGAGVLAERFGGRGHAALAAWLSEPGTGLRGERIGVVVHRTGMISAAGGPAGGHEGREGHEEQE